LDISREGGLLESAVTKEPTAEEQIVFLTRVQRLFAEGEFTATYKFALLISLVEIAIEVPSLSERSTLEVSVRSIALKFIELYWRQSFEFVAGRHGTRPGVLAQNLGDQAAVVSAIRKFRAGAGPRARSLALARQLPSFSKLVSDAAAVVSAQPIKYLQNFGGSTNEFLYERGRPGFVVLRPGVAYCLRRFQPLIQQLARSHWVDHIKSNRRNAAVIGEASDLESFLFSASRTALVEYAALLRRLTGGSCFYCGRALSDEMDVDHFIPFSLYPRDLGHNFVLAHPACNRSKSDSLAAYDHLVRWLERNDRWSNGISEISEKSGFVHDAEAVREIGNWSYRSSSDAGGVAWVRRGNYEPISSRHLALF
jgi:5-methylcytosine-specific restriction endonuclease McrA